MILVALVASVASNSRDAHAQVLADGDVNRAEERPAAGGTSVTVTGNNWLRARR